MLLTEWKHKNIVMSIIFLIGALTSINASENVSDRPKIAVYVVGEKITSNKKKIIEAEILIPFIQSGVFRLIERNDVFLSKIAEKQIKGPLDDTQISQIGKEVGVQAVLMVDVVLMYSPSVHKVYARLIDTETAEIIGKGESVIKSYKKIFETADDIYGQIFNSQFKSKPYIRFSLGQKFGAFGLNMLIPGLGSVTIMDDWLGAAIQCGLLGGGILVLAMSPTARGEHVSADGGFDLFLPIGIIMIGGRFVYNPIRTFTYKKRIRKHSDYGSFNMAILPNKHGSFNTYLMYNKAF
jgi:hypothetical protein